MNPDLERNEVSENLSAPKSELDYTGYLYFSEYLSDFYQERHSKNPSFSVRALAKMLGYASPSLIGDVLSKKRKPTLDLVSKLSDRFHFPKHQQDYLVKICEYERATVFSEQERIMREIRSLLAERTWKMFDTNQFDLMIHPHVTLLYSMMALKDFEPTQAYLGERLRFKLTQKQIDQAMVTLTSLGHIRKSETGRYEYTHSNSVIGNRHSGVESQLVTSYQLSMLELIRQVYPGVSEDDRDGRVTTLSIKKKDLPVLIDEIKKAHRKIMTFSDDVEAEEIYTFASQLIPMSKS